MELADVRPAVGTVVKTVCCSCRDPSSVPNIRRFPTTWKSSRAYNALFCSPQAHASKETCLYTGTHKYIQLKIPFKKLIIEHVFNEIKKIHL